MLSFDPLSSVGDRIELDLLEREATSEPVMKLGIQFHLAKTSFLDTILLSEYLVSNAIKPPYLGGYRRPIYSRQMVPIRITSQSMKP